MKFVAMLACAAALAACNPAQTDKAGEATPEAAQQESGPAYVGTWAADTAGCAIPQEQEGAPYVFHADGYDQHEAHCTWANVEDRGPNSWRIAAACQIEGDEASIGMDLVVDGDSMTIDNATRLVRCR